MNSTIILAINGEPVKFSVFSLARPFGFGLACKAGLLDLFSIPAVFGNDDCHINIGGIREVQMYIFGTFYIHIKIGSCGHKKGHPLAPPPFRMATTEMA